MRYVVEIPKPSAKRLEDHRRLVIKHHTGWGGSIIKQTYELPVGEDMFEFELDYPIELRDPNLLDGNYHAFSIEYENSTGSRKEEIGVTPIEF